MTLLSRKTPRDLFFFYVLEQPDGQRLLERLLAQTPSLRPGLLSELRDVGLLLDNEEYHPGYRKAFLGWTYRMRELHHPAQLTTRDCVLSYYGYLLQITRPTRQELLRAYGAQQILI